MIPDEADFDSISNRVAHASGYSAILLIERIVTAIRFAGVEIAEMKDLCNSVISGQDNDPAAAYALADFTHNVADAAKIREETMQKMLNDATQERASSVKY